MEKMKTKPKKRNKNTFKNSRLHSSNVQDYQYDKKSSVEMKAGTDSPNKADRDLEKLVTKKGVFPSATDHFSDKKDQHKKGIRYTWRDSGPGRAA